MSTQDAIRSIARGMVDDLGAFEDGRISIDQLSSVLKARLAMLEDAGADHAWVDELRALRNAIEVVSAFFAESGRLLPTADECREVSEIVGELRQALVEY